jgi:hypothetical protein
VLVLELDGELAAAGVDVGPPGRPPLVQSGVDTNNFPDRPLALIGTGTFGEPQPQRIAEVLFECGVVDGMRRLRPRSQLDVGCRRLTPCLVVPQVAGGLSE